MSSQHTPSPRPEDTEPDRLFLATYRQFFECFNDGRFYQAHDVLESWWLTVRREPEGNFHKALIQLAGAFVHLRRRRLDPCRTLLRSACRHLEAYASPYLNLDVDYVRQQAREWESALDKLDTNGEGWEFQLRPKLELGSPAR